MVSGEVLALRGRGVEFVEEFVPMGENRQSRTTGDARLLADAEEPEFVVLHLEVGNSTTFHHCPYIQRAS